MAFDPENPVETNGGNKARVISTDRKGNNPIIALIKVYDNGDEICEEYRKDGTHPYKSSNWNLINIPEPKPIDIHWGGIYKTKHGNFCIVIDPDEDLNHRENLIIRVLMCDDGKSILGLYKSKIIEHDGELKDLGKYLEYMNSFK